MAWPNPFRARTINTREFVFHMSNLDWQKHLLTYVIVPGATDLKSMNSTSRLNNANLSSSRTM